MLHTESDTKIEKYLTNSNTACPSSVLLSTSLLGPNPFYLSALCWPAHVRGRGWMWVNVCCVRCDEDVRGS